MTLSDVLTIAIALMVTYTMMSLLASTLQEQLSAVLSKRQKGLEAAIRGLIAPEGGEDGRLREIAEQLYGHALLSGASPKGKPSYVPARNFTLALLTLISEGSQAESIVGLREAVGKLPEGKLRQALGTLVESAGADLDAFRTSVDGWYNQAMDRLNGQYTRHTQVWLLGIGFLLAASLNVDTFTIVDTLMKSPQLRAEYEVKAQAWVKEGQPKPGEAPISRILSDLAPLPIGWQQCAAPVPPAPPAGAGAAASGSTAPTHCVSWERLGRGDLRLSDALTVFGWIFTAVAISFGAPFWFQLLNQLVNMRAAGPKPDTKDDKAKT
ncbi:hypothetical protein LJE71_03445 [Xanthobacter autotrophicus]|uniref:hypothetical protein n=1 Tax=Xanthobacter autotrophicus TaxID=280 RepID=UPI001E55E165|nr:hypothetical protein [Xanthobacter autotrophicus]UDQ90080.1 hypothetical protein LJE71_03445 [Xanthobacter autotrophicus]